MTDPQSARWNRWTILFLTVATLLRLPLLTFVELSPDEAYYWDWSRRISLGYYDQGPLIAYLIRLTTSIFGTNEFGVRIGVLVCSLITVVALWRLAVRLYSPRAGFLTAVLLSVSPLMTVGSLIATYDPPMVMFWALAIVALERALFGETAKSRNLGWIAAGLCVGLGFLAKHTAILIAPCLIVFLIWSPKHRKLLLSPQPYLAFLLALGLYTGVLIWNSQHHWWTFRHLLFLAGKTPGTFIKRLGDFLGSQALLLGPVPFIGTLVVSAQPSDNQDRKRFLVSMGLPVFLFFLLLTLKSKVQGNWAPTAWLSLTVLLAGELSENWKPRQRSVAWASAALSLFLTVALLSPGLRTTLGVKIPPDTDLTNTAYGWREMAQHVQTLRDQAAKEGRKTFLAGNGYQYPALMAFYLPDHPQTFDLFLHYRLTYYSAYVEELKDHLSEDAIFINENQVEDQDLRAVFESVEWLEPIPIWRKPYASTPVRTLHIARCRNFRRYVGLDWAVGG